MSDGIETNHHSRRSVLKTMMAAGLVSAGAYEVSAKPGNEQSSHASRLQDVVPTPVETTARPIEYRLTEDSAIAARSVDARGVAEYLAELLRPATGYELPVVEGPPRGRAGGIELRLTGAPEEVGEEGYRLSVTPHAVRIRANHPGGLFNGVQTLRQLLPPDIEHETEQSGPWTVPGAQITDYPRFEYRSAMLDVARHFFPVEAVKTYIDALSLYKINHLHLHLTDDQGWRIEIDSWPKLTEIGGSTEVGGGPGGFYTKDEYEEIVEYAHARNITIVPEIDMPGHTNAALASYAELNCDGERNDLYTGTSVGFSSLCVDKEVTYDFLDDVIREVAAMTPGPYIHVGGDEAHQTSAEEYEKFFDRVLPMIQKYGKRAIGWQSGGGILDVEPPSSLVAQYWGTDSQAPEIADAAQHGTELVVSPASRAYIDMKYGQNAPPDLGLSWAGYSSVIDAYTWNPGSYINGVNDSSVLGLEAPLWAETVETINDIETMAFPRIPGFAELGWSPNAKTTWEEYKHRLVAQALRWVDLDIDYYRSPRVPWLAQKVIAVDDVDIDAAILGGETEMVRVTVANWSSQAATVTASLDVPEGWETSRSTARVGAEDSATVAVGVTPPSERTEAVLSAVVDVPSGYDVVNAESQEVSVLSGLPRTPDRSGNGYTGLIRGDPDVAGIESGNALVLDGEGDYVDVNLLQEAPKLNFTEPGFTIEARINPSEITSPVPILQKGDRQYGLKIRDKGRGKQPELVVYGDTWRTASAAPPDNWENNWHTLAGVCTDSELQLYVDGELVDETSHSLLTVNEVSAPVHVGHNVQRDTFAAATIDYVHVYDRALSESELRVRPDEPTEDAVLWYEFDDFYDR